MGEIISVTRVTSEEAEAFRNRVNKQNERIVKWIVIDVDDFLELADQFIATTDE